MPKKRDTRSSANGKKAQSKTKMMKVNDTVFDKPEEETIRADFSQKLDGALKSISLLLKNEDLIDGMGISKGALYHGKPGLGLQAQKYLERHAKGITNVFPRQVACLTTKICEDTFKRAACCAPACIILLIGLEDATSDVEAVIARNMEDVWESSILTHVIATTAISGQVSKKLKARFTVVDLEELADSAHQV